MERLPWNIAAPFTVRHEAIEFHIEGILLHGEHVPEPTTLAELVEAG